MQKIITLPQIELNLENATVVELTAKIGALLKADDTLLVLETQKATVEVPCGDTGYLRAFLVKRDDLVNLHDRLAVLTDEPDEPLQLPQSDAPAAVPAKRESASVATDQADADSGKIRALPAARKRAKELGLDLAKIKGSGPQGRITVEDIERHSDGTARPAPGSVPLSARRQALIAQMETGHREIPQIAISRLMDVAGIAARQEGTTFTSRLVHQLAQALKAHPALLTALVDKEFKTGPVDVAVAMDTNAGLVAPVIRQADAQSLASIADTLRDLRRRAEENLLGRDDMKDGRFALTNLGMLEVDLFTPLVFSGQTAVLAVGRTLEENGRQSAWFTLAVDHRIVDGADAARFLATLQEKIGRKRS